MKEDKTACAPALEIEPTGTRTLWSRTMRFVERDALLFARGKVLTACHKLKIKPGINLELWDQVSSSQYRGLGFHVNIQKVSVF